MSLRHVETDEGSFSSQLFLKAVIWQHYITPQAQSQSVEKLSSQSVYLVKHDHGVFSSNFSKKTKGNICICRAMMKLVTISSQREEREVVFVWQTWTPSVCPDCQLWGPCCCGILWMASTLASWKASLFFNPYSVSCLRPLPFFLLMCRAKYYFNPEYKLPLIRKMCDSRAGYEWQGSWKLCWGDTTVRLLIWEYPPCAGVSFSPLCPPCSGCQAAGTRSRRWCAEAEGRHRRQDIRGINWRKTNSDWVQLCKNKNNKNADLSCRSRE